MHATAISYEFENLEARLKKTWMAGDYDRFSRYMENGARDFYERLDAAPGAHFLDVSCARGNSLCAGCGASCKLKLSSVGWIAAAPGRRDYRKLACDSRRIDRRTFTRS